MIRWDAGFRRESCSNESTIEADDFRKEDDVMWG